jgi:hypothetical protein
MSTKNITIDGVKYKFNMDKAINDGYLTPDRDRRIGQIYRRRDDYMMLCQFDYKNDQSVVALIDLNDGNRWTGPVKVNCSYNITYDEWTKITGGDDTVEWVADNFSDLFVKR